MRMTIGKKWSDDLQGKKPLFDLNENVLAEKFHQQTREKRAEEFLERVKAEELSCGISSCVSRGSNALCLEAPDFVLGTTALREFQRWLADEEVGMHVGRVVPGCSEEGAECTAQLNFMPKSQ